MQIFLGIIIVIVIQNLFQSKAKGYIVAMFSGLDYRQWCTENGIHDLVGITLENYGTVEGKKAHDLYSTVDPAIDIAFPPELDDLIRLHYLVRTRKVTTILEFGVGKSTIIFADALSKNKEEYGEYVAKNLRRSNPFEIHSVDTSEEWIATCKKNFPSALAGFVHFSVSTVQMTTFNGRACTMYDRIPNICPDLLYLDGPDQYCVGNDVHGISTASADRLPMAADILLFEPFLLPGTLIVVDGRTANARFLRSNLQRNWEYLHDTGADIHLFELVEAPLGTINKRQLEFCLGDAAKRFV